MHQVKGFVSIPSLANNNPDQVALFGELSIQAQTYSRDRQHYDNPTLAPSVEIVTFKNVDSSGIGIVAPAAFSNLLLTLGQWVYQQHTTGQIPTNTNKAAFIASINATFPQFTEVTINQIVPGTVPSRNMPDQIKFKAFNALNETEVTLWFSNGAFLIQNTDFELFVIPPTPSLDTLNSNTAAVQAALSITPPSYHVSAMNNIIGVKPPTQIGAFALTWVDQGNPSSTLTTEWTYVTYGLGGTDTEEIRNAIRNYISANSTLTVWPQIYPSLFSENEFTIVPLWSKLATPGSNGAVNIFSAQQPVNQLRTICTARLPPSYAAATNIATFANNHCFTLATMYQSLTVLTLGNPSNLESKFKLQDIYPDLMCVPTTSPDFIRMSSKSQQFTTLLLDALHHANIMTVNSVAPNGFGIANRGSRRYLTFAHEGFIYNVLLRVFY